MKKFIIGYLFFISIIVMAAGQEKTTSAPEPEDPGIILPAVILEIEDLSIEKVDAGLPEGSDISLPERELLLPEDISLGITEPQFNIDLMDDPGLINPGKILPGSDGSTPGYTTGTGGLISAEAVLGAGDANSIVSSISFYKSGDLPRFKFLFDHSLLDGYASRAAGTGFNRRYDELLASILFNIEKMELEAIVNFKDQEQGLQGQGDFYSVIDRFITTRNNLKYKVSDLFTFSGNLDAEFTSLILTGGQTPPYTMQYPPTEILIFPGIAGTFYMDAVNLGFSADYKYRNVPGSADYDLHRLFIKTDLKIVLPFWLDISGNAGYFRSSQEPMLFPFQLALSGSPSQYFSFGIKGGYFLEENNIGNLLTEHSYLDIPADITDNHGWFGAAAININLADNVMRSSLKTDVKWNKKYYYPATTLNSQTTLFGLNSQADILSSEIEAGILWTIIEGINLDFAFHNTMLWAATGITADNELRLTTGFKTRDDVLGAQLETILNIGTRTAPDLPFLNCNLFYRIMNNVNLACEVSDILYPLLGHTRMLLNPYIAPGIKGLIKIEINF